MGRHAGRPYIDGRTTGKADSYNDMILAPSDVGADPVCPPQKSVYCEVVVRVGQTVPWFGFVTGARPL